MKRLTKRLIIKMDAATLRWLKAQAAASHDTVSAYVRRLIHQAETDMRYETSTLTVSPKGGLT